jgi:uncharacterized membrane protein
MKYNNINTHYYHNNHNNHNPKERRKCRKYVPLIYLGLEFLGVIEGFFFGYFVFGQSSIFTSIALGIALVLVMVSISKTFNIYKSRCIYKNRRV